MTSRAFLLPAVLVFLASTVRAQWASRSSAVPLWADSALTKAGFWAGYDFTSRVSPEIAYGDLDGDGLWDIALVIVDKAGRLHGVAIVNQIDGPEHIPGAGQALAHGRVQF